MWETKFPRACALVRKGNTLSVILIELIFTRQQVPAEICMENAGCEKCDVTMEMIYYQQKGSLMEPSN